MSQPSIPREEKDFLYHIGNTMECLKPVYFHLMPEQRPDALEIIWQGAILKSSDADTVAQNIRKAGKLDLMDLILVACAYCAHARREHIENRKKLAWTYLAEAKYYAGAALYAKALEVAWAGLEESTARIAIAKMKSKGGEAKNAGWKTIENEAVRLIKNLGEQGQKWTTERKMAASIKSELWPFASIAVPEISEKRYIQTISNRLKLRHGDIGIYLSKRGKS